MAKKHVGLRKVIPDTKVTRPSHWLVQHMPLVFLAAFLGLIILLMIRNEPFRSPYLAYGLRVILAVSAAYAVQVVPGFLELELSDEKRKLTTGGAVAFGVVTFFGAPEIATNLDPANVRRTPPLIFPLTVFLPDELGKSKSEAMIPFLSKALPQPRRLIHDTDKLVDDLAQLKTIASLAIEQTDSSSNTIDRFQNIADRTNETALEIRRRIADDQWIFGESEPFQTATDAFTARVLTMVSRSDDDMGYHKIFPFLVRKDGETEYFRPLFETYASELDTSIVHVPTTEAGDRIVVLVKLELDENSTVPSMGSQIVLRLLLL